MYETLLNIGFFLLRIGIKVFIVVAVFLIAGALLLSPLILIGAIACAVEISKE